MKKITLPKKKSKRPTRNELLATEIHGKHFVWWDNPLNKELKKLENALKKSESENDMQKFLEKYPKFLAIKLGGGHGRWVIPKTRLGSEYVTDFMIGERHSFGYEWVAVELESPKAKMFTKSGNPTKELSHAIRQIQDWRAWIMKNQDYASRDTNQKGLGLVDISPNMYGLIFIGSRFSIDKNTNALRKQMINDLKIDIRSYDYLVDSSKKLPLDLK